MENAVQQVVLIQMEQYFQKLEQYFTGIIHFLIIFKNLKKIQYLIHKFLS